MAHSISLISTLAASFQAHIARARALVIATPETVLVRTMVKVGRELNPATHVAIRSYNVQEGELLDKDGARTVFVGESELARSMTQHVLKVVFGPQARGTSA